jgi:hypothetical protein
MKRKKGNNMKLRILGLCLLFIALLGRAYADDRLYLHLECSQGQKCIELAYDNGRMESVVAEPELVLAKEDVQSASVQMAANTAQPLQIELGKEASQRLQKITGENIGKRLMVVFDNKILIAPTVNMSITNGKIAINGGNGEQGPFWKKAPWLEDLIRSSQKASGRSVIIYAMIALAASLSAFVFVLRPRKNRGLESDPE